MKTQPVICLFGSYDETILSSHVILRGLFKVYPKKFIRVAHVQIPHGVLYEKAHLRLLEFLKRLWYRLSAQIKLLRFFSVVYHSDVLFILPFGLIDLFQASLYKYFFSKKIIYIPQVSLYDLFTYSLGKTKDQHVLCWCVYQLERFLIQRADVVIFNSTQEANDHKKFLNLPNLVTEVIPLGADDALFTPGFHKKMSKRSVFKILFYGEYNEGQGVDVIIRALHRLKNLPITLELVGDGKVQPQIRSLVKKLKLKNVQFEPWLSPDTLVKKMHQADLTLGMFGNLPVSYRVLPNKVYQGLATASTVVTGDTPAAQEFMKHKHHAYLVPMHDDKALALGIVDLYKHPALCKKLRKEGHELYERQFAPAPVSRALVNVMKGIL